MDNRVSLQDSAKRYLADRDRLLLNVANDPSFKATGLPLYPFDSINTNLPRFLELFDGVPEFLTKTKNRRVMDIGGANGDIAIVFSLADYETTVIDFTLPWSCGPLIASLLNKEIDANLRVVDLDVDAYFTIGIWMNIR